MHYPCKDSSVSAFHYIESTRVTVVVPQLHEKIFLGFIHSFRWTATIAVHFSRGNYVIAPSRNLESPRSFSTQSSTLFKPELYKLSTAILAERQDVMP